MGNWRLCIVKPTANLNSVKRVVDMLGSSWSRQLLAFVNVISRKLDLSGIPCHTYKARFMSLDL